jgi:adenosylcobinamide kinase/adenosylcobinamide-phosphate guanylyltransferase
MPVQMNSKPAKIFVLGGCRSGKSRHALQLGEALAMPRRLFVATCRPLDEEMHRRVADHRRERGNRWDTLEAPDRLAEAVEAHAAADGVVLVDCLTLWISNLMMEPGYRDWPRLAGRIDHLAGTFAAAAGPVILVSNEVGAGVVPENELARYFRDAVGYANQKAAAAAGTVVWMVAGLPVTVKQAASGGPAMRP